MRHLSLPSTQRLTGGRVISGVTVAAYPISNNIENNIGIKHLTCFTHQSIQTEPSQNRGMAKSGTSGTTSSSAPFGAYRNGEEKRENPGLSP